jgi:hypothetical protein
LKVFVSLGNKRIDHAAHPMQKRFLKRATRKWQRCEAFSRSSSKLDFLEFTSMY